MWTGYMQVKIIDEFYTALKSKELNQQCRCFVEKNSAKLIILNYFKGLSIVKEERNINYSL